MSLDSFVKKLNAAEAVVDPRGRLQPHFRDFIEELIKANNDNVNTANTDISVATASTIVGIGNPASFVWNSDTAGVFPASDPTRDLVMSFEDSSGTVVATRTLRGTLTSSSGDISITAVSSTETTGYSTSYSTIDNATASARADIVLATPQSTQVKASLAWTSVDLSVAGGTPGSGGGK